MTSFRTHGGDTRHSGPKPKCIAKHWKPHGWGFLQKSHAWSLADLKPPCWGQCRVKGDSSSINIHTHTDEACGRSWPTQSYPCLGRRTSNLAAGTQGLSVPVLKTVTKDPIQKLPSQQRLGDLWGSRVCQLASVEAHGCIHEYTQDWGDG